MEMAEALFHQFGEGIVAGIDTKNGYVAVHGWTSTSKILGTVLARNLARLGCKRVVFTDVARDGTFAGSNLVATREMVTATEMKVVASGGVASIDDVKAVKATGAEAVIVGKALYEGRLSLLEVKEAGL
jgi:phosphoribosylformimino-5-aminoimidazole carboxamide ribotide isomerase